MEIWDGADDLVRRIVKALKVDWNASLAVRIAGSLNCKPKYAPNSPRVRLAFVDPGLSVSAGQLHYMGLVAARDGVKLKNPGDEFIAEVSAGSWSKLPFRHRRHDTDVNTPGDSSTRSSSSSGDEVFSKARMASKAAPSKA